MRLPHLWIVLIILNTASIAMSAPVVGGLTGNGANNERLRGLTLLSELNCTACHETNLDLPLRKRGPELDLLGERFVLDHILKFVTSPHDVKPGTVMPDVLGHLSEQRKLEVVSAIMGHLVGQPNHTTTRRKIERGDPREGEKLFGTIGCIACHRAATDDEGVPLGSPGQHRRLVEFLKNPLRHRPSGRMPDMGLTHFEAVDLAAYLRRRDRTPGRMIILERAPAEIGRKYFSVFGCVQCHNRPDADRKSYAPLSELRVDQGCLSGKRGAWPQYELSQSQTAELKTALELHSKPLTETQEIDLRLTQLNCLACHQRGEIGGPSDAKNPHFTGNDSNLGDQGRIPPPLTGAGAKLNPDWMRKALAKGESVRPYLHTRMPAFGETNVAPLIKLFSEVDKSDPIQIERVKDAKQAKNNGGKLVGNRGGLNCVACHTWRLESAAPIKALDLTTITERLRENWFHRYMRNPQHYQPLTIMPAYWPDGKATLKTVLDGNTSQQIDAIWQYLSYGRNVRAPAGIVREPMQIFVRDETVMLRRNYQGIGRRGIGVGYPAKVNLAFDAGQMRLGAIWRGDFIEASAAFRGQGSGAVHMMSRNVIRFPEGAAFAVLNSAEQAWPTNVARRLPGFQFKGYILDDLQRPTFAYEFKGSQITDRFVDRKESNGYFKRDIKVIDPPDGLHFRAATGGKLERVDERTVRVGRTLQIQFPSEPIIRRKELLFDLTGTTELKLEYRW
ncbi:MAG: hypothetical protein CMO80_20185 [Verrucomicrobiales bacterium]|nr:hypothetical protein [Verrucomicrobiales bacterium]|tara:strand:+ start:54 stop:2243 length:2190 start_codon:yes stop_codon:yes gene_type:complete